MRDARAGAVTRRRGGEPRRLTSAPQRTACRRGFAPAAALVALAASPGCNVTAASHSAYFENDALGVSNRDRYYTNGVRFSGMYVHDQAPALLRAAAALVPPQQAATTQVGWIVGQDMYTPADLDLEPPDADDRPYAGWLYGGLLVAKAVRAEDGPAGDHVNVLEVDVGVVGPSSQADRLQKRFHELIDADRGQGWDFQLQDEPGVVVQWEHRRRLAAGTGWLGQDWDAIGIAGVAVGNVFDHAAVGATVRWGRLIPRDFGPNTIHSTAVDVPDGDEERNGRFRWYAFAGTEARAVAHNIFLDGNSFRHSPDVDSKPLVGELRVGLAVEWKNFRFVYTQLGRSREFDGQDHAHSYGSLALTWITRF